jgi:TRAP-type C4-dicarboxylate transport system substrate-binding protein
MDAIGIIFDESITTRSDFWNNLSNDTKAILEEEIESAE